MQHDIEFATFLRRREVLSSRLDETRGELDTWIAEFGEKEPATAQLAYLEGLLATRSDLFSRLKELDDGFLDHVLSLRERLSGKRAPDSEPPAIATRVDSETGVPS